MQQLILAARAYGVGTTLTTLYSGHEDEVRELLGLPEDAMTMALLPLGYPPSGVAGRNRSTARWKSRALESGGGLPAPGADAGAPEPGGQFQGRPDASSAGSVPGIG